MEFINSPKVGRGPQRPRKGPEMRESGVRRRRRLFRVGPGWVGRCYPPLLGCEGIGARASGRDLTRGDKGMTEIRQSFPFILPCICRKVESAVLDIFFL